MESEHLEKKETVPTIKTITGDKLMEIIYKNHSTPQDNRFLPIDNGGVFKYFFVSELSGINGAQGKFYPIVEVDDKIVGLSELQQDPTDQNNLWIKFISVDPEFRGRHYGSMLTEEVFRFAKQQGKTLESSIYSDDGLLKLKPKLKELSQKYSVQLKED